MKIEKLSTLKINQLTQEQYEKAKAEDKLSDSELYFTPASPTGGDIDVTEYAYSKTETYSRSEVDAKIPSLEGYAKTNDIPDISGKQDKLTFDGTYNASTNKAATVQTVRDEVAKIVADAPEDLNTLKEMSTWIAEHTDSAATMNRAIQKNTQDIANMQEKIVSEKDEFHIVDANYNIVATIDKDGLHTTSVDAKAIDVIDRVYFRHSYYQDGGTYLVDESESETDPVLSFYGMVGDDEVRLTHIASPVKSTDVANKKYVDDEIYKFSSGDNTVKTAQTANALKSGLNLNGAFGSEISVYFNTGKAYVILVAYQMYNYTGVFVNVGGTQEFMLYGTAADNGIKCKYNSSVGTLTFTKDGTSIAAGSCYIREL